MLTIQKVVSFVVYLFTLHRRTYIESVKSRVCPNVPPSQSCPLVTHHQCSDDTECQFGLKCCLDNCIRQCIVPVFPGKDIAFFELLQH